MRKHWVSAPGSGRAPEKGATAEEAGPVQLPWHRPALVSQFMMQDVDA